MTPAGHIAMSLRSRVGEAEWSPQGWPERVDSVEITTGDPVVRQRSKLFPKQDKQEDHWSRQRGTSA